jgi:hypothetical protein
VGEITWVLKDRRVTKRVSEIKNFISHFHRSLEIETPHPEGWRAVVSHKESTFEFTVVEGCVLHELTFSRKMPNTVGAHVSGILDMGGQENNSTESWRFVYGGTSTLT